MANGNGDTKDKVKEILKRPAAPSGYEEALQKLRDIAAGIQESLGEPFVVRIEPGYRVNQGQQFKLAIRLKDPEYSDFLFRAYVPPAGFPVTLDLFGEEHPACADVAGLEAKLLEFLRQTEVVQRIDALRDLVARH